MPLFCLNKQNNLSIFQTELKQSIVANFDRYYKDYIIKPIIKRSVNGIVKMSVDLKTDK